MKLHPELVGVIDEEFVFKLAKKAGLHKINYDRFYKIKKLKSKGDKPVNIETGFQAKGAPYLISDGHENVAIYVSGISDQFKTSAILKCTKTKKGFKLETLNSYYTLELA